MITALPAKGTLKLNDTDVKVDDEIPVAQLGNLKFKGALNENGNGYAEIGFAVKNAVSQDASANKLTFNVTPVEDEAWAVLHLLQMNTNAVQEGAVVVTANVSGLSDVDGGIVT